MTDNRTTELLRKLLDERGADWRIEFDGATEWESAAGDYSSAVDVGDGKLVFTGCLTPEQAIAATLGDKREKEEIDVDNVYVERIKPRLIGGTPTEDIRRWSVSAHSVMEVTGPSPFGEDGNVLLWLHENSLTQLLDMCDAVDERFSEVEQAALGNGTCRNEWEQYGKFRCSECWTQVDAISTNTTQPMPIRHCPNCGRRVER